ncbi:tRNA (guanosine(18)-2'-O)-methyltransferase [Minicystis rosea]|nr:tRNA (guanosine(18)-2'-O)-methyltransferase [Minicystis rosea]
MSRALRRTTPNCSFVAVQQRKLIAALGSLDPVAIARVLEDFVRPERAARLRNVFAARLDALTVVMDAPHDPHNGAAVIRSCDAFGVHRLHVIERIEPFLASNQVARGSERWVDVRTHADTHGAVAALAASGHELVATHPDGDLVPADLARIPRLAIILGNERLGIEDELRAACRHSVRIPMRGFAESLNVSVTAAILLQQASWGRPGDLRDEEQALLYARALALTVPHAPEILAARGMRLDLPDDVVIAPP